MIEKEFGTLNSRGLDYYGVEQNAAQMIDECFNLARNSMAAYSNTLTLAQDNDIEGDLTRSTEEKLIRFAVEISERMKSLSTEANQQSKLYQVQFDSTQNYNYQDGTAAMDNFYFTLSDNSLLVLENAFDLKNQYELKGLWVNKLVLKLIDIDPARYAGSIEKEQVSV